MDESIRHLLILGCGYVGERLGRVAIERGARVSGTTRSEARADALAASGIEPVIVSSPAELPDELLQQCDALVDSIPLVRDEAGMHAPQLEWLPRIGSKLSHIRWAGYLSSTGVYGDAGGAWVDETCDCRPTSQRGRQRLRAESAWLDAGLPAEVFRIAGIYGPRRNIIPRLMSGEYKAVRWEPPHWSNRIHVDDIVDALMVAMQRPRPGRIVNLADDEPMPHADYVSELARMVGASEPVMLTPEEGERELGPAMLAFFRDNKRVGNRRLHAELLPELRYPGFRNAVPMLMEGTG
ncbi:MAG TPA: SDR family oxidoreductase [Mariprofundaceae bacterium]|nr:SDR family oxidoreductase [Mariprofundaceae bacterium]